MAIGSAGGHCRAVTRPADERNVVVGVDADRQVSAWAASGAMALTGPPGSSPLGPPAGMVPKLWAVAELLRARAAAMGARLAVDPLELLGERAALSGLQPRGDISCGGATRLLRAGAGWLAVTLARPEDVELVPAWLEVEDPPGDVWSTVSAAVFARPVEDLVARALLVGLPVGLLPPLGGDAPTPRPDPGPLPMRRVAVPGPPAAACPLSGVMVVDLSSLWAGPLCGALLAAAGATVIKVESVTRPDGARLGPAAFFDLLNAGKRSVALDLRAHDGVSLLHKLLATADVVIEASRPRALEQLGVDALQMLGTGTPRVWASISGHGRTGTGRDRVAFGDDAAVAGGLVSWAAGQPVFCADAVADPTTALVATAGILDALVSGGSWLLDISMAKVAEHLAGPTLPISGGFGPVAAPRARVGAGRGPRLGEHTAAVLKDIRR